MKNSTVLGVESKSEYKQDDPVLKYTVELTSDNPETYLFSQPKDADYYVLKPSHRSEAGHPSPFDGGSPVFLEYVRPEYHDFFVAAFFTGMRFGEVAAL